MGGQSWLADILAGVMILTTIYCVGRTVIARTRRRPAEHDVDVVHALMGVAMAGMLVASLKILPSDIWAVVFGLAAVWYAVQIASRYRFGTAGGATDAPEADHRHHHLPHLAMCCAMVYMLLAARAMAGASGGMGMGGSPSGAHLSFLALVLVLVLVGFAVWDTDRLSRLHRLAPARAAAARVETGLALARATVAPGPGATAMAAMAAVPAGMSAAAGTPAAKEPLDAEGGRTPSGAPVAPRLALCCQIAMGASMAYMLVLML